jgi:hypothetical protein
MVRGIIVGFKGKPIKYPPREVGGTSSIRRITYDWVIQKKFRRLKKIQK